MKNHFKSGTAGWLLIVVVSCLVIINLRLLSPPDVVPSSEGEHQFSAERALEFLNVIAAEPHSSGTKAHARVRDYIFAFCERQGLETKLHELTGVNVRGNFVRAGYTQNIMARLKGKSPGKSILVMAHYDSEPNTPGASDDGAGVAAMMEVIRLLKSSVPLQHDVIFLFTDMEEAGLLGAEAFVSQYEGLDEIALLLNFESRGNAGVSYTFEVSPGNGWLMKNYAEAVGQSFASSIGYEIYKVMPNDTDFSMFRKTGIKGYNSAFIDGFSYYHSMADRVENMDLRSLQNHGDILFRSLNHFGNISLDSPLPAEDAIFYNPVGNWLWVYPVSWDIPFMVVTVLLFMAAATLGVKKGRISISKSLLGIVLFLGFLVTSLALVWLMEKGILNTYPVYLNFDSYNSYNAVYYLISIIGLMLFCFTLWYSLRGYKSASPPYESFFVGGVFVLIVAMTCIRLFLPTGAYLIYYPLMVALLVYVGMIVFKIHAEEKPLAYAFAQIVILAPALSLWTPVIYIIFITFSHAMPLAAVVIASLCIPLIIPSLPMMLEINRWITGGISMVLIIVGIVLGHVNNEYTRKEPIPVFLTYLMDADTGKAWWVSQKQYLNDWMKQFIQSDTRENFEWYEGVTFNMLRGEAPVIPAANGEVTILKDTVFNGTRNLKLLITGDSTTNTIHLIAPIEVVVMKVNDRLLTGTVNRLSFFAIPASGMEVELQSPAGQISFTLAERKMGLPSSLIPTPLPENMIYGSGNFSNTTQVKRKITL